MNSPVILFRADRYLEDELRVAERHFTVVRYRAEVPKGSLVICRFSALPFYNELCQDLKLLGSEPINTFAQHQYIANFDYYWDIEDLTFPSWERLSDIPRSLHNQAFVVKGRTNSRKGQWLEKMYAPNFLAASRIATELATDGLIGQQGVIARQFIPLETFETGATGTPFTNEWRVFYYRGKRLAHGYYWGGLSDWSHVDRATPDFELNGLKVADEAAQRVKDTAPFVVVDVAKTAEGRWLVVELNDGCQSGLNDVIDPEVLYRNLREAV